MCERLEILFEHMMEEKRLERETETRVREEIMTRKQQKNKARGREDKSIVVSYLGGYRKVLPKKWSVRRETETEDNNKEQVARKKKRLQEEREEDIKVKDTKVIIEKEEKIWEEMRRKRQEELDRAEAERKDRLENARRV